jgi:hypothetical protein
MRKEIIAVNARNIELEAENVVGCIEIEWMLE